MRFKKSSSTYPLGTDKIALGIFDIFMAFPAFIYIMVLIGILGNGKLNLIILMTVSTWVIFISS
ncbi:hypothetical protein [Maledivibacter halophilus]|uniref:hypothetical protein n=1 Tax=Maledivibacter halophilus TaxID=36842 RepID=UPI0009A5C718|nr:hypothetical protein [Maledivibacter halophilus]